MYNPEMYAVATSYMKNISLNTSLTVKNVLSLQNSGCMMQTKSSFNESECVQSIFRDLAFYDSAIQHYLKSSYYRPEIEDPLLSPTLGIIQNLRKNCSLMSDGGNYSTEDDASTMWEKNSFENRKKMCKMMRGFHARTITFNRAMGYISSGDHRK
ncbi:interleukin-12 subunit alpha [Menidia menidia]